VIRKTLFLIFCVCLVNYHSVSYAESENDVDAAFSKILSVFSLSDKSADTVNNKNWQKIFISRVSELLLAKQFNKAEEETNAYKYDVNDDNEYQQLCEFRQSLISFIHFYETVNARYDYFVELSSHNNSDAAIQYYNSSWLWVQQTLSSTYQNNLPIDRGVVDDINLKLRSVSDKIKECVANKNERRQEEANRVALVEQEKQNAKEKQIHEDMEKQQSEDNNRRDIEKKDFELKTCHASNMFALYSAQENIIEAYLQLRNCRVNQNYAREVERESGVKDLAEAYENGQLIVEYKSAIRDNWAVYKKLKGGAKSPEKVKHLLKNPCEQLETQANALDRRSAYSK